jgi:hypothetical protein
MHDSNTGINGLVGFSVSVVSPTVSPAPTTDKATLAAAQPACFGRRRMNTYSDAGKPQFPLRLPRVLMNIYRVASDQ